MRLLVLSHLSANNNTPKIVHDLFTRHASGVRIVVASRYEETEVFRVGTGRSEKRLNGKNQLNLF